MDNLKRIRTMRFGVELGAPLSVFSLEEVPFVVRRCYWLEIFSDSQRGKHAHKKLKQLVFCLLGEIKLKLHDGKRWEEIVLTQDSPALLIQGLMWREIESLMPMSILCVLADRDYEESDYIRDFSEFLLYCRQEDKN